MIFNSIEKELEDYRQRNRQRTLQWKTNQHTLLTQWTAKPSPRIRHQDIIKNGTSNCGSLINHQKQAGSNIYSSTGPLRYDAQPVSSHYGNNCRSSSTLISYDVRAPSKISLLNEEIAENIAKIRRRGRSYRNYSRKSSQASFRLNRNFNNDDCFSVKDYGLSSGLKESVDEKMFRFSRLDDTQGQNKGDNDAPTIKQEEEPTAYFELSKNPPSFQQGLNILPKNLYSQKQKAQRQKKQLQKDKNAKNKKKDSQIIVSPIDFCNKNLTKQSQWVKNGLIWACALFLAGLILIVLSLSK